jgi:dihydrofolate synthase/folylpolyglutamate synthase
MSMTDAPPRYLDLLARLHEVRRVGVSLGLERVREVLGALGSPERRGRYVQIAGTNGKGSTAAMTAALVRAAGLRTGLYTSPHLSRFTERIRVDGREVDGDRLAVLDRRIQATGVPLTYFEVATVLGFLAFADAGIEVGVLETGLGGRLDATTVGPVVATAITGIAFDHTEILGDTLGAIAGEKAGIARPGIPLFLGPMPPEAEREIARVAERVGAPIFRHGRDFASPEVPPGGLAGAHQRVNAALAVALCEAVLRSAGVAPLPADAVAGALAGVRWPGRLEHVPPDVLLDCAHNHDGAAALARHLDACIEAERAAGGRRPRTLIASVVEGKDAEGMLGLLGPRFDRVYVTRSSSDRAMAPEKLAALAPPAIATAVQVVLDPLAALAAARAEPQPPGATLAREIVVAGSIFLVGDLRARLLGEPLDPLPTSDPMARSGAGPAPDPRGG